MPDRGAGDQHATRGMFSSRMIFFQVLIAVGVLLLFEIATRVAFTVRSGLALSGEWFVYSSDLGWDRRPDFTGLDLCNVPRKFDHRGFVVADAEGLKQKPSQFKALYLGDSNTYGFCLETRHTFVEVAKRLVPEHSPINLGVNGYTSFQGYKALLKYGDLVKPNIVFIAFNYNDRRFAQEADSDAVFRALGRYGSIRDLGESIYLFRVAAFLHRRLGGAGLDSLDIMPEVRLDRVRPRVDPGGYRENLTMMVQWARQRRIPVVFVLFGDNPNATYVLRQGIKYLSEKRYELAIKLLRQARDHPLSQFVALAGLYLSRAYSEAGLKGEAQDALALKNVRSSLHGIYPILLDSEYHEIAREVAGKFGIQVIDAASELNKTPNVYFDFAHFDPEGHEIVGRLVADVIKGAQMNSAGGKP